MCVCDPTSQAFEEFDGERNRSLSNVVIVNQNDETVAVAKHTLKWVANT